ncbi:rhamnogalacturonan lyase B N-terminal domain-containing protein [Luteolibacter sp. LG18]|uniref:rhamnogalacturonan lyase B N-terminal domain-containing protein n=1 Tax=Luteolibacter sp. LG18 TaxID=2819286 RepID=UPI0030C71DE9
MKPTGRLAVLSSLLVLSAAPLHAEFGVVTDAKAYTVDSGAGLVFRVNRSTGNLESIKLNGTELNGKKASGIASGLGPQGTTTAVWSDVNTVKITVATTAENQVAANFTQYYIVRRNENTIYMATHAVNEPRVGELRWITRLQGSLFPNTPEDSTTRGTTKGVESKDVFGTEDGITRSKYYGNQRAKDLSIRGVSGSGRAAFMVYGNRESSSGGPFYRDIQNQSGSDSEVYNYMNSGHAQTEERRLGVLFGPYALMFTTGATPPVPDMGFIANLGLTGYVPVSGRGKVVVRGIGGRDASMPYTVAFANATAQYWTDASRTDGSATCANMKPGSYTMTVYKNELAVYTAPVSVAAGQATTLPPITITTDPAANPALWRIGVWDGTPLEFRNGPNLTRMHPSDKRQAPWSGGVFTVGKSKVSDFPAVTWRGVNEPVTVSFTLTPAQVKDCTIRIGTTTSFSGGRPAITLNSTWSAPMQKPVGQPDSRSLTIGTYRTNYGFFSFRVPAKALVAGENKLEIKITSGNGGSGFLSPSFAIDCVDFY